MKAKDVEALFRALSQKTPHPETELFYTNPYTLLVAVILSARATDKGVNRITPNLFHTITTPEDMIKLGEEGLKSYIRTIGLYPSKARHILRMSHQLVRNFKSRVPDTKKDLISLAGVGDKTANVVLNVAFHQDTFPVDTHVFRVCNRTGLAPGVAPKHVELALEKVVPRPYRQHAHHWLILHGRYTCKARNPLCTVCVIASWCGYFKRRQKLLLSSKEAHTERDGK